MHELIEEAEMMENLGIVLPGEIQMLLAKKNSLLDDIMKVNNLVNAYNSFVSSMNDLEVSFFTKASLILDDFRVNCNKTKNIIYSYLIQGRSRQWGTYFYLQHG